MQGFANRRLMDDAFAQDVDAVDVFLRRAPATMISVIVHLVVLISMAIYSFRTEMQEPFIIEMGQPSDPEQPEIESIVIDKIETEIEPEIEEFVSVPIELDAIQIKGTPVSPEINMGEASPGSGLVLSVQRNLPLNLWRRAESN